MRRYDHNYSTIPGAIAVGASHGQDDEAATGDTFSSIVVGVITTLVQTEV
jgi:hypothetical protein